MMPEELRTEKIIIKRELKADVSKCDDLVAVLDRCKLDVFEAQKPGSALKPAFSSLSEMPNVTFEYLAQMAYMYVTGLDGVAEHCFVSNESTPDERARGSGHFSGGGDGGGGGGDGGSGDTAEGEFCPRCPDHPLPG